MGISHVKLNCQLVIEKTHNSCKKRKAVKTANNGKCLRIYTAHTTTIRHDISKNVSFYLSYVYANCGILRKSFPHNVTVDWPQSSFHARISLVIYYTR